MCRWQLAHHQFLFIHLGHGGVQMRRIALREFGDRIYTGAFQQIRILFPDTRDAR